MSEIYFSENDYCMIELLPLTNYNFIENRLNQIKSLKKMSVTYEQLPEPMSKCGIKESGIINALSKHLIKADKIMTEYGSYSEHIFAYFYNDVIFYYDLNEENNSIIDSIWLILDIKSLAEIPIVTQVLCELNKLIQLLLVDWGWEFAAAVDDNVKIQEYLRKRYNVFK